MVLGFYHSSMNTNSCESFEFEQINWVFQKLLQNEVLSSFCSYLCLNCLLRKGITFWQFIPIKSFHTQYFQEPDCKWEFCKEGLGILFESWTSPRQIPFEQEFLIENACPHMPDPAKCSVGVQTWWGRLANIIFSDEAGLQYCDAMNAKCTLPEEK